MKGTLAKLFDSTNFGGCPHGNNGNFYSKNIPEINFYFRHFIIRQHELKLIFGKLVEGQTKMEVEIDS